MVQRLDDGHHAPNLVRHRHRRSSRPGGFSAHIEDVGASLKHVASVRDRPFSRQVPATVGEAVRGHVDHAHDAGAIKHDACKGSARGREGAAVCPMPVVVQRGQRQRVHRRRRLSGDDFVDGGKSHGAASQGQPSRGGTGEVREIPRSEQYGGCAFRQPWTRCIKRFRAAPRPPPDHLMRRFAAPTNVGPFPAPHHRRRHGEWTARTALL